uniref:Uncharacterized protein n=1 Tax=Odontella aurita TaxID=265563 RepID=A0A7S4IDN4_9STRA|mmetsp:Transcript_23623/g.69879  ORF Transcript_23623/g.69879 Transcript_23623/m.69879 type:complete len:170 (+) Transcript_23623:366-875(+)
MSLFFNSPQVLFGSKHQIRQSAAAMTPRKKSRYPMSVCVGSGYANSLENSTRSSRRVRFVESIVSDVIDRPKLTKGDLRNLFYTPEEIISFQTKRARETLICRMFGCFLFRINNKKYFFVFGIPILIGWGQTEANPSSKLPSSRVRSILRYRHDGRLKDCYYDDYDEFF